MNPNENLNTGYGAVDNCGDVDAIFTKRTIPAGTECTLALLPATVDLTPGQERITVSVECVDAGEYDGVKFDEAFFLDNTPKNANEPYNTSYHFSRAQLTRIVAAVRNLSVDDPKVAGYWASIPRPDDSLESIARAFVQGLNSLSPQTFKSAVALKQDMQKGATGRYDTPKMNPNTGEPYPPKNKLGRLVYPRPAKAAA